MTLIVVPASTTAQGTLRIRYSATSRAALMEILLIRFSLRGRPPRLPLVWAAAALRALRIDPNTLAADLISFIVFSLFLHTLYPSLGYLSIGNLAK